MLTALLLAAAHATACDLKKYIEATEYEALRALAPELPAGSHCCSITQAGADLWMRGQMRVHDAAVRGDFNGDGRPDVALRFSVTEEKPSGPHPRHILVATKRGSDLKRLALTPIVSVRSACVRSEEIPPNDGLFWLKSRKLLCIETGESERFTAPATMTWPGRGGRAGYVIEGRVLSCLKWYPKRKAFDWAESPGPDLCAPLKPRGPP